MSDAARLVDELLRTGRYGPPTRPDEYRRKLKEKR
jgi:hypothetical protein